MRTPQDDEVIERNRYPTKICLFQQDSTIVLDVKSNYSRYLSVLKIPEGGRLAPFTPGRGLDPPDPCKEWLYRPDT
jgi:hypothetical protein